MVTRCECCDLPVESCGRVLEQRQRDEQRARRARALDRPGVVAARFPGRCPSCKGRIAVDDPVRHSDDGWVGVLCCPTDLDD